MHFSVFFVASWLLACFGLRDISICDVKQRLEMSLHIRLCTLLCLCYYHENIPDLVYWRMRDIWAQPSHPIHPSQSQPRSVDHQITSEHVSEARQDGQSCLADFQWSVCTMSVYCCMPLRFCSCLLCRKR